VVGANNLLDLHGGELEGLLELGEVIGVKVLTQELRHRLQVVRRPDMDKMTSYT